jgi:subtilisin
MRTHPRRRVAPRGQTWIVRWRRYVLLPPRGLRWHGGATRPRPETFGAEVLDTVPGPETGAALLTVPVERIDALRRGLPGELAPVRLYRTALSRPGVLSAADPTRGEVPRVEIGVVSSRDGRPMPGATVVAFTDFEARIGDRGRSRLDGSLRLRLGDAALIERLYVFDVVGHWSLLRRRLPVTSPIELALRPLDFGAVDHMGLRYGSARSTVGRGVRVAVVDTGIALDHPDLKVAGGQNCVTGEDPDDFGPAGAAHGTHVAGTIAGRGSAPTGRRGVAPGAELRSYRVFGRGRSEAANFAIAKAIDAAVQDGCDVINLSLGGGGPDPVLRAAIEEAEAAGAVVVAAAGNEGRAPVGFPAELPDVLAISGLGRTGTFPPDAAGSGERQGPFGHDGADFIAAFSNVGAIDLTAPGVAVVATVPGGYLDLDGTSMACAAASGVVAKVLSGSRRLRSRPRSPERAADLVTELRRRARPLGFPPSHEGDGLAQ